MNMSAEVRVLAPGKVNFNLNVLPPRADGFHNIESIFQTVSLFDELTVCLEKGYNTCAVECQEMTLPESNTITSAYSAFYSLTGFNQSVKVNLVKKIPSGGGLGGGSSDAAAFVKALSLLSGITVSPEMADRIAEKVGSDVFFFLHCTHPGCALVSGRGEIVHPIKARENIHILLVLPDVHSSTKEAYSLVDRELMAGRTVDCPAFSELEDVYNGAVKDWNFANSFTVPVAGKYPEIAEALAALKEAGALFSDMSGSGAVVFGVFDTSRAAEYSAQKLRLLGMNCVVA